MKLKHLSIALCIAMSHAATCDAAPSIADVNKAVLSENAESTFYQPDYSEKHYYLIGNKAIIEGDVVVGDHDQVQMYGIPNLAIADSNADDGDEMTANSAWSGNTTWPNGVVPYVISANSQGDINAINAGMSMIANNSGVRFVQRTNQADYIEIIKSNGCWSHVGRRGGRQELSIGNGCAYANTVAHEFLHALGFYHEQSRSDRDNYVRINWQNISAGREHNFDKHGAVTSSVGSYDPYSIMHYGYTAFSSNGQPTIDSLMPGIPSSQLGQGNGLTSKDIAGVVAIYGNGGTPAQSYGPLTIFEHCDFGGYKIGLPPVGALTLSTLGQYGFKDNDLSSFTLAPGFAVRFYQGSNLDGSSHGTTSGDNCLANNGFNDNVSSIYLRGDGDSSLSGLYYIKNRNSGLYIDVDSGQTHDGANLLQWHYHGGQNQQFEFTHQGNGVYVVRNVRSGKAIDIAEGKHSNGINVQQWTYGGALNQRFVLRRIPNTNYHQLIAMHSGKSIKIAGGSTSPSANIEQWQNDNQVSSHWQLVRVGGTSGIDIKKEAESYSAMSGVQTETTQDPNGGNLNVGWIDTGDWMSYHSISIPTSGSYTIEYRVASQMTGGRLSLDIGGGTTVLGYKDIPNTGGWQNWTTVSHTVNIPAGTHNFGIFAQAGGWNINWFRIKSN